MRTKPIKRLLAMVLAVACAVGLTSTAWAIDQPPVNSATSACVMDVDSGRILYSKNENAERCIASITKIMTAILVIENNTDFDQVITASKTAAAEDGTSLYLVEGDKLTLMTGLYGTMLRSGNDAAVAIAEHTAGSVEKFVQMMNDKAKALGCTGTHFTNPTGLHSDNTYTTARDMAIMAKYAMQKSAFSSIVKNYAVQLGQTNKHADLWQYSTNKMLLTSSPYYYAPVVGIKTGSTDEAGRCVISQAEDSGYHYFCVVMGSPVTAAEPYQNFIETRQLYRWAFGNFSLRTLLEQGELMAEVPVKYSGDGKVAKLAIKEDVVQLLRDDISLDSIIYKAELPEFVEAPIAAGDTVGKMHIMLMGEEIGTVELVATQDFSLSWFRKAFGTIGSLLSSTVAKVIFIVVVLAIAGYIVYAVRHNKKRKKHRSKYSDRNY